MDPVDIYNEKGERIGTLRQADPDPHGLGCFSTTLIAILAIACVILAWPSFFLTLKSSFNRGDYEEIYIMSVFLAAIVVSSICCTIYFSTRDSYKSFMFTWLSTTIITTIAAGFLNFYYTDKSTNYYDKINGVYSASANFFGSFFMAFMMSVSTGCIVAIIVHFIQKRKAKKEREQEVSE